MYSDPAVAGSWPALITRLHARRSLLRWSCCEPALRAVHLDERLDLQRLPRAAADAVLGALLRIASRHGRLTVDPAATGGATGAGAAALTPADAEDAVLLVLHLLSGATRVLARRVADLTEDPVGTVVGELACQIRGYPCGRRHRAHALGLLADTRRAVLDQLLGRQGAATGRVVLTVDGADPLPARVSLPGPLEEPDVDVVDLLRWAVQRGVSRQDVACLIAVEAGRDRHARGADQRVATEQGVPLRTLYRRRSRALTALQALAPVYLEAVA